MAYSKSYKLKLSLDEWIQVQSKNVYIVGQTNLNKAIEIYISVLKHATEQHVIDKCSPIIYNMIKIAGIVGNGPALDYIMWVALKFNFITQSGIGTYYQDVYQKLITIPDEAILWERQALRRANPNLDSQKIDLNGIPEYLRNHQYVTPIVTDVLEEQKVSAPASKPVSTTHPERKGGLVFLADWEYQ